MSNSNDDLTSQVIIFVSSFLIGIFSSYLWEFVVRPLIVRILPSNPFLDSFALGFVIFALYNLIQRLPIDPKTILNRADTNVLRNLTREREYIISTMYREDYNSSRWKQHSEKLNHVEERIKDYENRIKNRK